MSLVALKKASDVGWWQRYGERLGNERSGFVDDWTITLERGPFRSVVQVRLYGRLIRHWVCPDAEAERIYDAATDVMFDEQARGERASRLVARLDQIG